MEFTLSKEDYEIILIRKEKRWQRESCGQSYVTYWG